MTPGIRALCPVSPANVLQVPLAAPAGLAAARPVGALGPQLRQHARGRERSGISEHFPQFNIIVRAPIAFYFVTSALAVGHVASIIGDGKPVASSHGLSRPADELRWCNLTRHR